MKVGHLQRQRIVDEEGMVGAGELDGQFADEEAVAVLRAANVGYVVGAGADWRGGKYLLEEVVLRVSVRCLTKAEDERHRFENHLKMTMSFS